MKGTAQFCVFACACGAQSTVTPTDAQVPTDDDGAPDDGGDCVTTDPDGDGHLPVACGGDDCDDLDPGVLPGAADEWPASTVLGDMNCFSLALSPSGEFVAAYGWGPGLDPFTIATWDGNAWRREEHDIPSTFRPPCLLSFDASGGLHLLQESGDHVYDTTSDVIGDDWQLETFDLFNWFDAAMDGQGRYRILLGAGVTYLSDPKDPIGDEDLQDLPGFRGAIALGPAGQVHVAYRDSSEIWHAFGGPQHLEVESIDVSIYGHDGVAIAADSSDQPRVFYEDDDGSSNFISFAERNAGRWTSEPTGLPDVNFFDASMVIDPDGKAHVCYAGHVPDEFTNYATNASGPWTFRSLMAESGACEVIVDSTGEVHVVYERYSDNTLRHEHGRPPNGRDDDCDGQAW